MAKTKTRDEVMSEAYWTPKEKEDLNSKVFNKSCEGKLQSGGDE